MLIGHVIMSENTLYIYTYTHTHFQLFTEIMQAEAPLGV